MAETETAIAIEAGPAPARYPTIAEAAALARRAQAGDRAAVLALYDGFRFFARQLARRYRDACYPWVDLDDLRSMARLGLLQAIPGYDETKGAFSTHASWWIRHAIDRGVRYGDYPGPLYTPPESVIRTLRTPAVRAAAQHARGLTSESLASSAARAVADDAAGADPVAATLAREQLERLAGALDRLPRPLRAVVREYHGLGRHRPATWATIGRRRGITREAARKRYGEALRLLRRDLDPNREEGTP